jgi:hypothetical protein
MKRKTYGKKSYKKKYVLLLEPIICAAMRAEESALQKVI